MRCWRSTRCRRLLPPLRKAPTTSIAASIFSVDEERGGGGTNVVVELLCFELDLDWKTGWQRHFSLFFFEELCGQLTQFCHDLVNVRDQW